MRLATEIQRAIETALNGMRLTRAHFTGVVIPGGSLPPPAADPTVPYAAPLTVKEVDGSPSVDDVTIVRVPNGSLANDGGGQVTITFTSDPTLGGDLSGTASAATVIAIQGRAVSATAPATADRLRYTGTQWAPSALIWTPITDGDESLIFAGGELIYVEATP